MLLITTSAYCVCVKVATTAKVLSAFKYSICILITAKNRPATRNMMVLYIAIWFVILT